MNQKLKAQFGDFGAYGTIANRSPYVGMQAPQQAVAGTRPGVGWGAAAASAAGAAPPSGWAQAGQFAASPTGAALINAAGGYLVSKGQEEQAERDRQAMLARTQQDARLQVARDLQSRAGAGIAPLGEAQTFANRRMLEGAVASKLFGGGFAVPGPAGAKFQPMAPPAGFTQAMTDPTQVKAATAQAIANAEADRLGVNPHLAQTDLGALGLQAPAQDPRAAGVARGQQLWNQQNQLWDEQLGAQRGQDLANQTGKKINPKTGLPKGYELDPQTGDLKKESFWKTKWGKAIKYGALGAATIATAGAASPARAAAIAAGSGAFQGATSGGGWKGALMGAGLGAATGGLGGGGGAGVGQAFGKTALTQTAKTMLKDPRFYAGAVQAARS
jgi:hypothetical protein